MRGLIKYIFKLYIRFWPITVMTLFGYSVVMTFDSLMPAFVAKNLADVVGKGPAAAFSWLGLVAAAYMIIAIFHFFESRNWMKNAVIMRRWVYLDLYRRVMENKQFKEFKYYPPEYWTDAIYVIRDNLYNFMIDVPRRTVSLIVLFIINAVIFMGRDPVLALVVLTPALITIAYIIHIALRVRVAKRKIELLRISLRKNTVDSFGNVRAARANSALSAEYDFIDREEKKYSSAFQKNQMVMWKNIYVPRIVDSVCMVIAILVGMHAYFMGRLPLDLFVFMVVSMGSMLHLANEFKTPVINFIDNFASFVRSFEIINGNAEDAAGGVARIKNIKSIEVKNITFGYNNETVLKNVSWTISARDHIGINGKSGAGKTTLFNIILGLYRPRSGSVFINGVPLGELDIKKLRKKIYMSVQNAPLLNRTIAENIKFANPRITRDGMILAAKRAQIHDFIMTLPDGYDTAAGVAGSLMSGGQINRIMLARAFASNADVLLLDEPTAALDAKTAEKIIHTIRVDFRDKIVVIISHDKNVLLQMGRMVAFKNHGRIE